MGLQPVNTPPDGKMPTVPEMELRRQRNSFTNAKKKRNCPAGINQGLSTASKTAVMCTACRDYARPPPPISPFLLV